MSTALLADDEMTRLVALWQRDLGSVRRLAPKTLEAYSRDVGQFFAFPRRPCRRAGEHRDARRNARRRSARLHGAAARGRRRGALAGAGLSAIKSLFRFLEREGVLSSEALNTIRAPEAKKSLPKALTVLEAKATITTTDEMEDRPWVAARDMAVLSLCYGAGLRISEALSLSRADLEGPTLRVTGKGGKTRLVPLIDAVRAAIETYLGLCRSS